MTGTKRSRVTASRAAWRSAASSFRVELRKTRTRWSGVRISVAGALRLARTAVAGMGLLFLFRNGLIGAGAPAGPRAGAGTHREEWLVARTRVWPGDRGGTSSDPVTASIMTRRPSPRRAISRARGRAYQSAAHFASCRVAVAIQVVSARRATAVVPVVAMVVAVRVG